MPTPLRNTRIPDEIWFPVQEEAIRRGETVAEVITNTKRRLASVCTAVALALTPSVIGTNVAAGSADEPRYKLIDLGTFGGPGADIDGPARTMTASHGVLGFADTTTPDADYPNEGPFGENPVISHAFLWRDGHLHDLGALPGNTSSSVFEMNGSGLGVGRSEDGRIDPRLGTPEQHPVLFDHGRVVDLGTLPGGTQGFALSINDRGQIVGFSNTGLSGPGLPKFYDWKTQVRGFIWQHGVMHDLGTLGGPGTQVVRINQRGMVAGDSFVDSTVNQTTGFPAMHAFIWVQGRMRDLGSLGGNSMSTSWMNERGQSVGVGTLPGDDQQHPWFWDGHRLRDLGTLGGDYGVAWHINDRGDIVGYSLRPPPGPSTRSCGVTVG